MTVAEYFRAILTLMLVSAVIGFIIGGLLGFQIGKARPVDDNHEE